jgi:hypothetical protein
MSDKIICPNCGAHLIDEDKVCYVCGQVVENLAKPENEYTAPEENVAEEDTAPVLDGYNDYVEEEPYEDEVAYRPKDKPKKSKTKKTGIICGICVAVVAVLAVIVCVCFANGVFSPAVEDEEYTVYFDKPSSDLNLIDESGTVYNWSGDVEVVYTLDGEQKEASCKMSVEYDNLWEVKIPAEATDLYFSPNTTDNIRTQSIAEPQDEYAYYVTDTLLDENLQLVIEGCPLLDFSQLGINYVSPTVEETTEPVTEVPTTEATATEQATETTEQATEPTATESSDPYSITVPTSWTSGTTVITKGNCTSYYETYNYKNYQMGNLMSIYVVDASDTSFSEMNNVKMVKKTADGTKKIVVVTPTDIEFNDADETATDNYISLSNLTNQVISSITPN